MSATKRPVLIAAVPTPFAPSGGVDLAAAKALYTAIDRSGVDALFVAGTTGEFVKLTASERLSLIEVALEVCTPSRVVAHVGTADGAGTEQLVRDAVTAGARRLAVVTPFDSGDRPEQLVDHFRRACEAADGASTHAYIYPSMTRTPVALATLAALAGVPGLAGAKVSAPGAELIAGYSAVVPEGFDLLTGSDRDLAAAVRAGASGAVSGVSAALAEPFLELIRALELGDTVAQSAAQARVEEAVDAIGPSIALLKLALELRGLPGGALRVAAPEPDPGARSRLAALLSRLGNPAEPA